MLIRSCGIMNKIFEATEKGSYRQEIVLINGSERVTDVYEYNNVRVNVSGRNGYIVSSNPF